jgi:hypothetical protein
MSSLIAPDQNGRKIKPNTATSGKPPITEVAKSGAPGHCLLPTRPLAAVLRPQRTAAPFLRPPFYAGKLIRTQVSAKKQRKISKNTARANETAERRASILRIVLSPGLSSQRTRAFMPLCLDTSVILKIEARSVRRMSKILSAACGR